MVFGLVLGVISFVVMAYFVNLVAAFLTLLAIAFYVVVYTMLLKRTTPQNIVIGGAAGALPPVIGWAAVTGDIGLPALLLFALVFYWTPPHFWALSLRIRKDYAAAGVPMLPVVKGIPETTRQIAPVHGPDGRDLAGPLRGRPHGPDLPRRGGRARRDVPVAGVRAVATAHPRRRSTAGAIRLYKYSITYLTLLFVAVAVDALVVIPLESSPGRRYRPNYGLLADRTLGVKAGPSSPAEPAVAVEQLQERLDERTDPDGEHDRARARSCRQAPSRSRGRSARSSSGPGGWTIRCGGAGRSSARPVVLDRDRRRDTARCRVRPSPRRPPSRPAGPTVRPRPG